jgi:hypothetical protein
MFMAATLADYFDDVEQHSTPKVHKSKRQAKTETTYPPDKDIELWLTGNVPLRFQELVDIRYCLYHRCSRAGFTVVDKLDKDDFKLKGRSSSVRLINNEARHYLLWKLRLLARRRKWRGAIPRSKAYLARVSAR